MISTDTKATVVKAKQLYESALREALERSDFGRYTAIEPDSGDHFLGDTFDEAVNAAIEKYPDRLTHTIRIGHRAALHL